MAEEWVTEDAFAAEMGVQLETVRRWRRAGTGPAFTSRWRKARYRRASIEAWLLAGERKSTSETDEQAAKRQQQERGAA